MNTDCNDRLCYSIESKDWQELQTLIQSGCKEDVEFFDYDDWGWIFDVYKLLRDQARPGFEQCEGVVLRFPCLPK